MTRKIKVEIASKTPNPDYPEVQDISIDEVNRLRGKIRIVDVRRPDEWSGEFGHIPEAELIVLDTLPQRLGELDPEESTVFICRSGNRSGQAAHFAKQNGFNDVYNMAGGMIAWTNKKLEAVEKSGT